MMSRKEKDEALTFSSIVLAATGTLLALATLVEELPDWLRLLVGALAFGAIFAALLCVYLDYDLRRSERRDN